MNLFSSAASIFRPIRDSFLFQIHKTRSIHIIARVWEGKTLLKDAVLYTQLIRERDFNSYRKTPGFVSLELLVRSDEEFTYFKLLTFWPDFDSVKNFTGSNTEIAVSYSGDAVYFVDFPGKVTHFEVFSE